MKLRACLVTLATALALTAPADAAILLVNGSGQLTGATGVLVGSALYDVEFVDGTCAALFNGCDAASDFAFTTEANAAAASQALLDQVFLDGIAGNFDTQPELTLGCDNLSSLSLGFPLVCLVSTPYVVPAPFGAPNTFGVRIATNYDLQGSDQLGSGGAIATLDFGRFDDQVLARWTPSSVPEPASLTVLALGLAGLGVRRWRQRKP